MKNVAWRAEDKIFSGKNVVVTGVTGYLGSALIKALQKESCFMTVLCRSRADLDFDKSDNLRIIVGDLSDSKIWNNLVKGADYVFHLAGLEYTRINFNHNLNLQVNFLSVVNLLQACEKLGASPRIIFASSSNIAKNKSDGRVSEEDKDDPMSIWSLHKLLAEKYLNYYSSHDNLKTVSLRFSNIYGPSGNLRSFLNPSINKMIFNGIKKKKVALYSNQNSYRDFLYVDDAVRALLLAAIHIEKLQKYSHYYVGSDVGHSYYDAFVIIKDVIFNVLGEEVSESEHLEKMGSFEMRSFVSDSSAFRSITGFSPQIAFQEGVIKTVYKSLELKGLL